MRDVLIIGAGPAGMTAAIYATRAGLKVLVIEAKTYGGQAATAHTLKNFPSIKEISGIDFAKNLYEQTVELGAEYEFDEVVSIEQNEDKSFLVSCDSGDKYQARSIIIATGSAQRKLGLESEKDFVGRGISYCASCDGNFFKDKIVAVVGGGNSAFGDAIYLSGLAKKVYLVNRSDRFRADAKNIENLKSIKNVEILTSAVVEELKGEEQLETISLNVNGEKRELVVDGLFIAIGLGPATDFAKNFVSTNESGYVISDESCHTNIEGVFVAGDNREKEWRQVVTATNDGAIAASEANKYLKELRNV